MEAIAVSVLSVVHDNKENVPPIPSSPKLQTRLPLSLSSGKTMVVLSNERQRQALADITNLVNCRIGRCRSVPADISSLLVPAVVTSRKRRAVEDLETLKSTASKSLRMGFR